MDVVKIALIVAIAGIVVGIAAAAVVAVHNSGSRNLVLAIGTLAAAFLFLIQLGFELQRSKIVGHITTEFTVDGLNSSIRKWDYTRAPAGWRISVETGASDWLKAHNLTAFTQERDRLFSDFSVFSLVSFLTTEEFDWQLQRVQSAQTSVGAVTSSQSISKDRECTSFDEQTLHDRLARAGNLFAGAHLIVSSGKLRLPPKSTLDISSREVTIRNPICEVTWKLDPQPSLTAFTQPGADGQIPLLASNQPRYETRVGGFNVEVTYFALRSQNREAGKYREWVSRLMADSHLWFEGNP